MRIMFATDGSVTARTAARWLATLPLPADSTVLVVSVADVPGAPLAPARLPEWVEAMTVAARLASDDAVHVLAARWPTDALTVAVGDPRIVIPGQAAEWKADLLVVGGRGLGALGRLMLGSVSDAVAREAGCAVLVVKGEPRPLRRVLIAVDGSEPALAAVRFVTRLPLDPATVIRLVGVAASVPMPGPVATPVFTDVMTDLIAERCAEMAAALAHAATLAGGRFTVEQAVVSGRPADEIVTAARTAGSDLIVLGARGLGPVKRLLLGSVSEGVLHRAECPVLIVKGERR